MEEVKTILLEIIKEAHNLDSNELEKINDTQVYVKKGRVNEFLVNAYRYYEYLYNVKITDNMDFVTDIYNYINKELKEEENEYYDAKSYEVFQATKDQINKFNALNTTLKSLTSNYNKLVKATNQALKSSDLNQVQSKIEEITKQINETIQNMNKIKKQLINIKNNINSKVLNLIDEQMLLIQKEYLATTKGTKIAFAKDGSTILDADLEEYNSLYDLKDLLKKVENDNLIVISDFICVNKNQENIVQDLISKINIFKRLNNLPKTKVKKDYNDAKTKNKKNEELIAKINVELLRIRKNREKQKQKSTLALDNNRVLVKDLEEYNNLLKIREILNRPTNSKKDNQELEELMKKTNFFDKKTVPDDNLEKYNKENDQEITKLMAYLDELANKISNYPGYTNLPIKETKKIDDKVWVVPNDDLNEANNIIDVITILRDISSNMIKLNNIYYIKPENKERMENLLNNTQYFNKEPKKKKDPKNNDDKIKEYKNNILLINKAVKNKNIDIKQAQELIETYVNIIEILEEGKKEEQAIVVNDLYILETKKEKFLNLWTKKEDLESKINSQKNEGQNLDNSETNQDTNQDDNKEINKDQILALNEDIEFLKSLISHHIANEANSQELLKTYEEMLQILKDSEKAKNCEIFEGLSIDINSISRFKELYTKADNLITVIFETLNDNEIAKNNTDISIYEKNNEILTPKLKDINNKIIKSLKDLNNYLEQAKQPDGPVIEVIDYCVEEKDSVKVKELMTNITNLKEDLNSKFNEDKIKEIRDTINNMIVKDNSSDVFELNGVKFKVSDKDKIENLTNMLKYLLNISIDQNIIEYNGVYLTPENLENYQACEKFLNPSEDLRDKSKRHRIKIRKLKNSESKGFIRRHWKFIVAAGLSLVAIKYFISSLPDLAPAIIYANSCNALAMPALAGLFNNLSKIVAALTSVTYNNGAFLMPNGAIINAGIASSQAFKATLGALMPFISLGATFLIDKKLLSKKDKDFDDVKKRGKAKEAILILLAKLKSMSYTIKTNFNDFKNKIKSYAEDSSYVKKVETLMIEEHSRADYENEDTEVLDMDYDRDEVPHK